MGLRDVGALAEVLVSASRRGEDIGAADVLARYQGWRRFDATALALGMDAVNRLFSNDNPALRAGRDLGLGLVNALPTESMALFTLGRSEDPSDRQRADALYRWFLPLLRLDCRPDFVQQIKLVQQ